jgi:hypothetical protein
MNRSIGWIGVGIVVAGFALAGFPLAVAGQERLDPEQLAGFLVAPVGLVVVLIGAISVDPRKTTVTGTFGNTDEPAPTADEPASPTERPRVWAALEPVNCRFCRSVISADLANCPRCARARSCRACYRPLGLVLERPTCPTCARPEPACPCPYLGTTKGSPRVPRGPRSLFR